MHYHYVATMKYFFFVWGIAISIHYRRSRPVMALRFVYSSIRILVLFLSLLKRTTATAHCGCLCICLSPSFSLIVFFRDGRDLWNSVFSFLYDRLQWKKHRIFCWSLLQVISDMRKRIWSVVFLFLWNPCGKLFDDCPLSSFKKSLFLRTLDSL